jgi:hypothetical protein
VQGIAGRDFGIQVLIDRGKYFFIHEIKDSIKKHAEGRQ